MDFSHFGISTPGNGNIIKFSVSAFAGRNVLLPFQLVCVRKTPSGQRCYMCLKTGKAR